MCCCDSFYVDTDMSDERYIEIEQSDVYKGWCAKYDTVEGKIIWRDALPIIKMGKKRKQELETKFLNLFR